MEWGRAAATDRMLKLVVGDTERCCGKLKNWKGFSGPNFGLGPIRASRIKRKLRLGLAAARFGLHGAIKFAQGLIPGPFFRQRGTVHRLFAHYLAVVFQPTLVELSGI
jgi:hypothetical protein